jgi:hypothetical protein
MRNTFAMQQKIKCSTIGAPGNITATPRFRKRGDRAIQQGNRVWHARKNGAPHICAFHLNLLHQGFGREASRR